MNLQQEIFYINGEVRIAITYRTKRQSTSSIAKWIMWMDEE